MLTAKDVPGENDISPTGRHDEPVLADGKVEFYGQPIFCVIAETREQARRATRLAKVEYKELPFVTDIGDLDPRKDKLVTPPLTLKRGDAAAAIKAAPHRLKGQMRVGGQEHFYLEGHIAMAVPGEDEDVTIYSSTQHPSEVQHMVSHALGVPSNAITVEIRRMGGGFGGKETQGNQFAALAAIAAKRHHRAVKIRPDRDDDMIATGKRHDFLVDYEVGFDDDGNILGVDFMFAARCGFSSDLSGPVTDRALSTATTPISGRRCMRSRRRSTPTPCRTPPSAASAARKAWWVRSASSTRLPLPSARIRSRSANRTFMAPRIATSRPITRRSRTTSSTVSSRAGGELGLYEAPPRHRGVQRQQPLHQARPGADAGQVRHLVHGHALQPGRRAGACLH
ncbi:hypothetical protein AJ88_32750 [Mesorhizobium amorphae CCBAU 01583]|nr:hypothetical protein AJ88_32750 [Mesorhizobium amorphae CCBAU 01583]